ncbi:PREDICTED: transmembrane protein 261 [Condylura cristata]|uniref:transmembrane protein 261 n=1 Tax=Condylura cristata TaxID=143302 RepID=UPI0003345CC6|nr:PREDICTED: transmembrane protein 261 [Condylura cristata]
MGSHISQPLERVKVVSPPEATSSANPAPFAAPGAPTSPAQAPAFNNCWSCRVLSGFGLMGAGGYVFWVARKPMKMGYPPSPGTVTQMVVGISIACWGIIILSDPKGKAFRVGLK